MKKKLSNIVFLILILMCNVTIGQEHNLQDVLQINKTVVGIQVSLVMNEQIDSTHYKITVMNRMRQKVTKEFWSIENPYSLEIPVNIGEYAQQIEITTYYKGKIVKNDKFQTHFHHQKNNNTIRYVLD